MSRKRTSVGNKLAMSVLLLAGTALPAFAEMTPIKHVVVIFQQNVSFDHYFATYPNAMNAAGQAAFTAQPGTPSVNGLTAALIAFNTNGAKPFRLDRSHAATCDQDHAYKDEQAAMNSGLMDKFVEKVGTGTLAKSGNTVCHATDVIGYFDDNTVTALWNYAQEFAMSDNFFGTTFGPSTPGALNLISGQTNGAIGSCALEPASAQGVATPDSRRLSLRTTTRTAGTTT
jgi:phospholipase C